MIYCIKELIYDTTLLYSAEYRAGQWREVRKWHDKGSHQKATIESVIMIISHRGGGRRDQSPLRFKVDNNLFQDVPDYQNY